MGIINNFVRGRNAIALFFFFLISGHALAQPSVRLFRNSTISKANSPFSTNASYLTIDHEALSSLLSTPHVILTGIPLPHVAGLPQTVDLDVTEFSVVTEKTKVTLQVGDAKIPAPLPTVRTYRGKVRGNPNTLAFIAAQPDGNVSGFIRFNNQENFSISAASRNDGYTSIIIPMSTVSSDLSRCEMTDEGKYSLNGITPHPLRESGLQTLSQPLAAAKTCVVAIDEDYACYQEFGNNVDYITARLAAITTVYESEIGVAMSLGPFNCWTTPDPYNGSGLDPLLQSFTNYWVSNHQGDADQRTLAHLISRRIGGGGAAGIAWVGGMCRPGDIGYGLTNISGTMTGVDEAVMAHELGHNVGSQHTHNCAAYPPSGLDHCVAAEGGCSWTPVQSLGCIMSYCNNKTFSFDTPNDHRVVTTLQDAVDQATCLASLAQIRVNDTAVTFAKTDFGTSRDTTITAIVTSTGTEADLKIIGMTIGGTDANAFTIKKHPQFPAVLTNGQSINVTITFSPNYGGDLTGQLQILHNATGGSSVVNLYGHSATPKAYFIHDVANDPNYILDYGTVHLTAPIDSTIEYVRNDGDGPLKITRTWFTSDTSEFSIVSGGAPVIIPAGANGSMVVRFKAKSNGLKMTYLDFKTNDPNTDTSSIASSMSVQADVQKLAVNSSGSDDIELSLSPNPFKGVLQLELRAGLSYIGKPIGVEIFDNLGRKVGEVDGGKLDGQSMKLKWQPDASLSDGAYNIKLKIGNYELLKQVILIK